MDDIRFVTSEETLFLRHKVLRPNQEFDLVKFPTDSDGKTFHVGAFVDNQLTCVATFFPEVHEDFQQHKNSYRLRGMATETEFQGQGLGRKVLEFAFEELARRGCSFLWCNAREDAFGFYERLGFSSHGALFDIPGVHKHKVMYKQLG